MIKGKYVQYGCGLCAPDGWENYDSSPTLRLQKIPVIGKIIKNKLNVIFPDNVLYGDIVKGLPVPENYCNGVYSSHTLEHLSLQDFKLALNNTKRILKADGIFRCVVPDLEKAIRNYVIDKNNNNEQASLNFMHSTLLGIVNRPRGLKGVASSIFGNSHHLWMWDIHSLIKELTLAGFRNIRECKFNDSEDEMFKLVENEERFVNSVAIECRK